MPTYFPENNAPQSADSLNRSLQKINGLLAIRGGALTNHSDVTTSAAASGSQLVMAANESRAFFFFQNTSDTVMSIDFGVEDAGSTSSFVIQPNGSLSFNSVWVPSQAVRVRCASTGKQFIAKQGT